MVGTATRSHRTLRSLVVLGAAMLALMALIGARGVMVSAHGEPHLAHIHPGTCDELDPNPAFPLNDVSHDFLADGTPTAGDEVGSEATLEVKGSTTTVEATLDDILGSPHAINLHESAEAADVYVACGNVAGFMVDDSLVIGLAEQNDSGISGVAILTPDGDSTIVTIYVTSAVTEDEGDGEEAAAEEAVEIVDFLFSPPELTVAVGTTVTWTNQDSAPHTATADDGSFDSGRLNQGDSFSFTFDTPGTYGYVCAFHPNMVGTITVE